jgi:hypothetical protein
MKKLMSDNCIILNVSRRNKSRLIWRNKVMKQPFEPVCQNFRDDLIDDIAQANRFELVNRRGP